MTDPTIEKLTRDLRDEAISRDSWERRAAALETEVEKLTEERDALRQRMKVRAAASTKRVQLDGAELAALRQRVEELEGALRQFIENTAPSRGTPPWEARERARQALSNTQPQEVSR